MTFFLLPKYNDGQVCIFSRWLQILDKVDGFHIRVVLLLAHATRTIAISMILGMLFIFVIFGFFQPLTPVVEKL